MLYFILKFSCREHQVEDWKVHKTACNKQKNQKAAPNNAAGT